MSQNATSERMTYLLSGQTVEWVKQESATHLTIRFVDGPEMLVAVWDTHNNSEIDISIVATEETSRKWVKLAENPNGPKPLKR